MAQYVVGMQTEKQEKFYFIREKESMNIVLLPSKYLMHKKRSKISPNTIRRSAFALSYYLNYMDENQLHLDDIYQMKYAEQHEHFTEFLIWLKAGEHSREEYSKLPNNETCNAYLKEVFRFYTFMERENGQSESLKVLSDAQTIVRNSIGVRRVLNRKSFHGYLKEKGHQGKTIEQDKIVSLLQECANCRDQVLLLLLAETGFRIGDDDDKIRLNQRKPSKYKGLSRFGPEKNLQRINKFMKERPTFYKKLIQMKENFRFYLRCFYCITKVVILQFNSEKQDRISS